MDAKRPARERYQNSVIDGRLLPFEGFAESWYQIAWSHELAPGQVLRLRYFDQDLQFARGMARDSIGNDKFEE